LAKGYKRFHVSVPYKTPVIILTEAKALLVEKGLHKGSLYDPATDSFCSSGAVYAAAFGKTYITRGTVTAASLDADRREARETALGALTEALTEAAGGRAVDIVVINDRPEATLKQVVAIFDRAIKVLRARA
jgi:hypothetical protein